MSGSTGGARRASMLLASTLLARIPITIFPVFFVLQSQLEFDRYDAGGYTVLAFSVGATVNGLLSGWMFARLPHPVIASVTGALAVVLLLLSAAPGGTMTRALMLGGLIGLVFPPLHIGSRALYPRLLDDRLLLRFYSLDVSLIQITWVVAPVLVVAVAPIVGISVIYVMLAGVTAVGCVWYAVASRGIPRAPRSAPLPNVHGRRFNISLFLDRRLHVYLLVVSSLMLTSGLIMPMIVAESGGSSAQSMAILIWSLGSAIGSFVVNRDSVRPRKLAVLMAIGIVSLIVALSVGGMVLLDAALFLLGLASAPINAAVFYFVSQHFRTRYQSLVFGLITSFQIIAEGVGTSVSGNLLDAGGVAWIWALILVALVTVLATLGLNLRRAFTHMPVPRTGIIPVIPQK